MAQCRKKSIKNDKRIAAQDLERGVGLGGRRQLRDTEHRVVGVTAPDIAIAIVTTGIGRVLSWATAVLPGGLGVEASGES